MSSTSYLDLRDLSLRGGEEWERTYRLEIAPILLGGVEFTVLVPDGVEVFVRRVTGGYLFTVAARARVYGPCARCLKEVALDFEAEEEEFAPTSTEGWDERDLSPFIADQVVDVAGLAREAIILALPNRVLCDEECAGLCPRCGKDLNQGSCDCPAPQADDRWAKLKDLQVGEAADDRPDKSET
jgi:uncharacterized protein